MHAVRLPGCLDLTTAAAAVDDDDDDDNDEC